MRTWRLMIYRSHRPQSVCSGLILIAICAVASILSATVAANAADAPTLDMLDATRQRPLFSPTRRAPPEEKPRQTTGTQRQQQPPDVVLNAIIVGSGVQVAWLKRAKETKAFPVRTGADVDGWSVTTIAPRHVVLSNNTQSITLEFPKRGDVPTPAPAAPSRRAEATR